MLSTEPLSGSLTLSGIPATPIFPSVRRPGFVDSGNKNVVDSPAYNKPIELAVVALCGAGCFSLTLTSFVQVTKLMGIMIHLALLLYSSLALSKKRHLDNAILQTTILLYSVICCAQGALGVLIIAFGLLKDDMGLGSDMWL